jgi:hypothetical protein
VLRALIPTTFETKTDPSSSSHAAIQNTLQGFLVRYLGFFATWEQKKSCVNNV